MWNSISTENQFCATKPRKYNDPPECCSFQAKPAVSSERSPWCCHVKLSHSRGSSHTWSQRAQLFPLPLLQIRHSSIRFPVITLLQNLSNLKNSVLKGCLAQLLLIMEDATPHGGDSSLPTGDWFILSAGSWRMKPLSNNGRDPQGWNQPPSHKGNPWVEEAVS